MIYVGLDYSLNSPAQSIKIKNKTIINFIFKNNKQYINFNSFNSNSFNNNIFFIGHFQDSEKNNSNYIDYNIYKYSFRANYVFKNILTVLKKCANQNTLVIGLESYSYSSKGLTFKIGEYTGIFKYIMQNLIINNEFFKDKTIIYKNPSPSEQKKLLGFKGNAKKKVIINKFIENTKINLFHLFGISPNQKNITPIDDIADSFFISEFLVKILDR